MYETKFQGEHYESIKGRYVPTAELSAMIRANLKAAIKAGDLPGKASDYRVNKEDYAGGRSIRVRANYKPEFWARGTDQYGYERDLLTEEGKRVKGILERLVKGYQIDRSEIMVDYFDVNYYGFADIQDARSADFEARQKAAAAARKAAKQK